MRLVMFVILSLYRISATTCRDDGTNVIFTNPIPIVLFLVGKVDDTTARLLIEIKKSSPAISDLLTAPIVCLQNSRGEIVSGTGNKTRLISGRPTIFKFHHLLPQTDYIIIFDGISFSFGEASFRTYPPGGFNLTYHTPNIAAVSCNNAFQSSQGHWKNLLKFVGPSAPVGDRLSLLLHIGDQVYLDCGGGKTLYDNIRWREARKILGNISEWQNNWGQVVELFRKVYHTTWRYPPTAKVLANVPNLQIMDDHDIEDDWGMYCVHDIKNIDWFIGTAAYYLYLEYQSQLYMDINWDLPLSVLVRTTIPFHKHSFGDIGIILTDIRSVKTFYNITPSTSVCTDSHLGITQKKWLSKTLNSNGDFKNVKALIFVVTEPIVMFSTAMEDFADQFINDMEYYYVPNAPEQLWLLNTLHKWMTTNKSRDVVLVAGDVHVGGFTLIQHGKRRFVQMTTSPIANPMKQWQFDLVETELEYSSFTWLVKTENESETRADESGAISKKTLKENRKNGWSYSNHFEFTRENNFGILRFQKADSIPKILLQIHTEGGKVMQIHATPNESVKFQPFTIFIIIVSILSIVIFLICFLSLHNYHHCKDCHKHNYHTCKDCCKHKQNKLNNKRSKKIFVSPTNNS